LEQPIKKQIKQKKRLMLLKYRFPLNLLVVFEKMNAIVYTTEKMTPNHYVIFVENKWVQPLNFFLKNELFYNNSTLNEMSAIDTVKYNSIFPEIDFLKKNRVLLYSVYYTYFAKIRLTVVTTGDKINSIDKIFKNANWLEREVSEMYKVQFIGKQDSRPLLLDYSKNEFPMLKDFPTEGVNDIYYNFFENKLSFVKNEFIEL
jgi:NADH:ubiquinone oxidoreductase subunit C